MNILIVQTAFIGDIILSTPVISGVKKLHPTARITLMTTPVGAGLFCHDPRIDEIIVFDKRGGEKGLAGLFRKAGELRRKKFDRAYSLHRSHRTSVLLFLSRIPWRTGFADAKLGFLYTHGEKRNMEGHAVFRNMAVLLGEADLDYFDGEMELHAPKKEGLSRETRELTRSISPGNFVVLAPGSAWKTKQWHPQGYAELASHLRDKGMKVVLIGGPGDVKVCGQIAQGLDVLDLSGKIPLTETLYFVKHAAVLVCNDSMALHMGSAFKTPTVCVFCATSPAFGFGPWRNPHALVVEDEDLECKPCRRHGSMKCPQGDGACMRVPSSRVIRACGQLLGWDD